MELPPKGKRTKPVSRSTNHKTLRGLKCFKEIHKMLVDEGRTTTVVASFIHTQGELTHVSTDSLEAMLRSYRLSIPPMARALPINPSIEHAVKKAEEGLDELLELQRLYRMQMDRIEIDFQTEKNIKKLLPTMSQEIRTAREILSSAAQLKMDLGLNERHLGKVDVETTVLADVAEKYADSPSVAKVMDNGDSRRKVLGLAEKLLAIASRAERHPEVADQLEVLSTGGGIDAEPSED
jgi:hypothetical protein